MNFLRKKLLLILTINLLNTIQTCVSNFDFTSFISSRSSPENVEQIPPIVTQCGYPTEKHEVITQDGYKLTLFRVPNGILNTNCSSREPVMIHHGLMSASTDWFCQACDRNLPLILAENCFDVWVANARGTEYSRGHVKFDSNRDADYWEFSFDEIGRYDLPAAFDYILNNTMVGDGGETFKKLNYVGHSMGTTVFYVCMHYHPEYNSKVRKMAALAPVAYIGNPETQVLKLMSYIPASAFELACKYTTNGEFGVRMAYSFLKAVMPRICPRSSASSLSSFCEQAYFAVGGPTSGECLPLNSTVMNQCFKYFPHTVSCRMITHYLQLVRTGKFETQVRYNDNSPSGILPGLFNGAKNWLGMWSTLLPSGTRSNSLNPPSDNSPTSKTQPYQLSAMRVPTMCIAGSADLMDTPSEVNRTCNALGTPAAEKIFTIISGCNHLDLILAIASKQKVFFKIKDYFLAGRAIPMK